MGTHVTLHSSSVSRASRSKLQPSSGSWNVHSRNTVGEGGVHSALGSGDRVEVTHAFSPVFPPQAQL